MLHANLGHYKLQALIFIIMEDFKLMILITGEPWLRRNKLLDNMAAVSLSLSFLCCLIVGFIVSSSGAGPVESKLPQ